MIVQHASTMYNCRPLTAAERTALYMQRLASMQEYNVHVHAARARRGLQIIEEMQTMPIPKHRALVSTTNS